MTVEPSAAGRAPGPPARTRGVVAGCLILAGIGLLSGPALGQEAAFRPHEGPSWRIDGRPLRVDPSGRRLVHSDGKPFLYLGDTAWELFHRLNREEAESYLENRRARGFTVIQAVALAEKDGLGTPNAYGHTPLLDTDPTRPDVRPGPANDYWDHIDYVVELARKKGMYIGFLPTWGDKVGPLLDAKGPQIFNERNARSYGRFLGRRFRNTPNIIWILGGDRPVYYEDDDYRAIHRAMARGLEEGDGGRHLMTFHPRGGRSSSTPFHHDAWLDFNMIQSGHQQRDQPNYKAILSDYVLSPAKPIIDGEPRYEEVPIGFTAGAPRFNDHDVRQAAYWAVLSGALGHTYGCNDIWQMYSVRNGTEAHARLGWQKAMDLPGAEDMLHLRRLLMSRPWRSRVPVFDLHQVPAPDAEGRKGPRATATTVGEGAEAVSPEHPASHVVALFDRQAGVVFFYLPTGFPITVNVGVFMPPKTVNVWWFNPRDGSAQAADSIAITERFMYRTFTPPGSPGRGRDWVLVIDDAGRGYPAPGSPSTW